MGHTGLFFIFSNLFFLLLWLLPLDGFAQAKPEAACLYINQVDSLFHKLNVQFPDDFSKGFKLKKKLDKKLKSRPTWFTDEMFIDTLTNRIMNNIMQEDYTAALRNIYNFNYIFPEAEETGVLLLLAAEINGGQGSRMLLDWDIRRLERFSNRTNIDLSSEISMWKAVSDSMKSKECILDEIKGVWVSEEVSESNGLPMFMFRVYESGIVELSDHSQVYASMLKNINKGRIVYHDSDVFFANVGDSPLKYSNGSLLDTINDRFIASFGVHRQRQGSASAADLAYSAAVEVGARTTALAMQAGISIGTQIGLQIGGGLLSMGLVLLGNYAATDASWVTSMILTMNKIDGETMAAEIDMREDADQNTTTLFNDSVAVESRREKISMILYKIPIEEEIFFARKNVHFFSPYGNSALFNDVFITLDMDGVLEKSRGKKSLQMKKGFFALYVCWPVGVCANVIMFKNQRRRVKQFNEMVMEDVKLLNFLRSDDYEKLINAYSFVDDVDVQLGLLSRYAKLKMKLLESKKLNESLR